MRIAAVALHAVLTLAAAVAAALLFPASPWRELGVVAMALPLVLTVRGLVRGRRTTEQRLAVLLVVYAGLGIVETISGSAAARVAGLALIAAVTELGLLLALIRRPRASGE